MGRVASDQLPSSSKLFVLHSSIGFDASVSPGLHRQFSSLSLRSVISGSFPGTRELLHDPPKSLSNTGLMSSIDAPVPFAPTGQGNFDRYSTVSATDPSRCFNSTFSPELERLPEKGPTALAPRVISSFSGFSLTTKKSLAIIMVPSSN